MYTCQNATLLEITCHSSFLLELAYCSSCKRFKIFGPRFRTTPDELAIPLDQQLMVGELISGWVSKRQNATHYRTFIAYMCLKSETCYQELSKCKKVSILRVFRNAPFYIPYLFHLVNLRMFSLSILILLYNGA